MKYLKEYIDFSDWNDEEEEIVIPATVSNLKVGDRVLVTDRLMKYIIEYDWDMEQFINKEFKVKKINILHSGEEHVYMDDNTIDEFQNKACDYYFPIDTLNKI